MTDWQERITRGTPPSIRVEHEIRYRLAAPLIRESAAWCDLGCGEGLAAAAALDSALPSRAVLVDIAEEVTHVAAREIGGSPVTVIADLSIEADLARVAATLLEGPQGPRVVTCFEVVEHLSSFVPLITALSSLVAEHGVDVVLSVPNDAFWSIENPHHRTMWGEGAFAELCALLPDDAVVLRQFALSGSTISPLGEDASRTVELAPVVVDVAPTVPTHMLVALGPRATQLVPTAGAAAVDLNAQRRWERQREAVASMVDTVVTANDELVATNADQAKVLRRQFQWFEEWRAYIHDLERRLGLPLSGAGENESPRAHGSEQSPPSDGHTIEPQRTA
jgi:Methyltransferase domain